MLDEMLAFFKIQKLKNEKLHFLFLTKDAKELVHTKAKERQIAIEDITVLSVPYQEMPSYIQYIDYAIFFIRPTFSKQASSPIKQAEFMSMGIPIICNAGVGDTKEIVLQNTAGYVFDELSFTAFDEFNLEDLSFEKEKAMNAATTIFSLNSGIAAYNTIYNNGHA
jgi:glycosyltransferase involved in cell wall biosynthesis